MTAFEPETGLAIPGSFTSLVLILLCILTVCGLFIMTRGLRRYKAYPEFPSILRGRSVLSLLLSSIAGVLMLVGAFLIFFSAGSDAFPALERILAILVLGTSLSLPAFVLKTGRKADSLTRFYALMPVITGCFWLIVSYKDSAPDPVIWAYAIEILAISFSVLGFFFVAGFPYGISKPLHAIFFCSTAVFFCIATLVDNHSFAENLIFAAFAIMQFIYSITINRNLKTK
jgi:uncharacterized membrane protein